MTEKDSARFWSKVAIKGPDDCWEWLAAKANGYGRFHVGGRLKNGGKLWCAHRVAYTLAVGPIPQNLLVCHKCDNPGCVNPNHLFPGTISDNAQDMYNKDRGNVGKVYNLGSDNSAAILTAEQVHEIRRLYALPNHMTQRQIGKLFGVSNQIVSCIVRRECWSHI